MGSWKGVLALVSSTSVCPHKQKTVWVYSTQKSADILKALFLISRLRLFLDFKADTMTFFATMMTWGVLGLACLHAAKRRLRSPKLHFLMFFGAPGWTDLSQLEMKFWPNKALWFFLSGFSTFLIFLWFCRFFLYFIISVSSPEISQGSLHREHMIVPYIIFTSISLCVYSFAAHYRRQESQW